MLYHSMLIVTLIVTSIVTSYNHIVCLYSAQRYTVSSHCGCFMKKISQICLEKVQCGCIASSVTAKILT